MLTSEQATTREGTEQRAEKPVQSPIQKLGTWAGPGSKAAIGRIVAHSPQCLRGLPGAGCEVQRKTGAPLQSIMAKPKSENALVSLVQPSVGMVLRWDQHCEAGCHRKRTAYLSGLRRHDTIFEAMSL